MAWNDQLVATTLDNYISNTLADNISKQIALLAWLEMKGRVTVDGGLTIREPLLYALNSTVNTYSGYDVIDTTPQGGIGYAEYSWKDLAGSITISMDEELKNAGRSAVLKLLQAKVDQLELSFTEKLNEMFFADGTGNGSKDFLGLEALVGTTNTVGGIDGNAETWWRSVVDSTMVLGGAGASSGIKELNSLYNSLIRGTDRPDFEITTQANFEYYESLAYPNIRFQSTQLGELGFEALAHKSAELVFDAQCGSGKWYVLNSKHLKFVQHSQAWMKRLDFVRPHNQTARTALVVSMGNLITNNRRMHGKAAATTLT